MSILGEKQSNALFRIPLQLNFIPNDQYNLSDYMLKIFLLQKYCVISNLKEDKKWQDSLRLIVFPIAL